MDVCAFSHEETFRSVRRRTYAAHFLRYRLQMVLKEKNKVMASYINVDRIGEIVECIWCGKKIGLAHHVQQHVCIKCFKKMRADQIPDDEIFGRTQQRQESTPA